MPGLTTPTEPSRYGTSLTTSYSGSPSRSGTGVTYHPTVQPYNMMTAQTTNLSAPTNTAVRNTYTAAGAPTMNTTPTVTPQQQAPAVNLNAAPNPLLQQLLADQKARLEQYKAGATTEANSIAGNVADAGAGVENAIRLRAAQRGADPEASLQRQEGVQQRVQARTQMDAMLGREREANRMLEAQRPTIMGSSAEQLAQNQLGLQAYQAQNAANMGLANTAFDQQMALLNAQRTSPLYSPIYWGY